MSSQLEKYLREVAVQLSELPEDEREEQIEEIRAHLDTYIEERKAAGATEYEAVQTAIAQFGSPAKVGRDIRRATLRNRLRAVGATMLGALVLMTVQYWIFTRSMAFPEGSHGAAIAALSYANTILIGLCVGLVLRQAAIRWITWFYLIAGIPNALAFAFVSHTVHLSSLLNPLVELLAVGGRVLTGAGGAWIGAKMAERLTLRRRIAAR